MLHTEGCIVADCIGAGLCAGCHHERRDKQVHFGSGAAFRLSPCSKIFQMTSARPSKLQRNTKCQVCNRSTMIRGFKLGTLVRKTNGQSIQRGSGELVVGLRLSRRNESLHDHLHGYVPQAICMYVGDESQFGPMVPSLYRNIDRTISDPRTPGTTQHLRLADTLGHQLSDCVRYVRYR